jgi:Protein of unknown function (DUF3800)
MFIFYGDESGFSRGSNLEVEQPITVYAGILINLSKLNKAIGIFDDILASINAGIPDKIRELKFSDIRRSRYPYSINYKTVDSKADLLEEVITRFQNDISFKVFYSAICDEDYLNQKKKQAPGTDRLRHPYVAAAYRVISRIEHELKSQKNNKGHTFVILDEQNDFQNDIETLIANPIHIPRFTQIIDTSYFGKSHYSKLIQIADLIAGVIRFHLCYQHLSKMETHFNVRIEKIFRTIQQNATSKECFEKGSDLRMFYSQIEKPLRIST